MLKRALSNLLTAVLSTHSVLTDPSAFCFLIPHLPHRFISADVADFQLHRFPFVANHAISEVLGFLAVANGKTVPVNLDYFKNLLETLYINVTNNTNMATNRK